MGLEMEMKMEIEMDMEMKEVRVEREIKTTQTFLPGLFLKVIILIQFRFPQ